MAEAHPARNLPRLTIGALARATGIPPETLRTWERRYGSPCSVRLPSGHRRYGVEWVPRLLRIRDALRSGHAPSTVVPLDDASLALLLDAAAPGDDPAPAGTGVQAPPRSEGAGESVSRWLAAVRSGESAAMDAGLRREWDRLTPQDFLTLRAGPLLREVGRRWRAGRLSIVEEHQISAIVENFLAERWRERSRTADGAVFAFATPTDEPHTLGLHQAALVSAIAGCRVAFLGGDLPPEEIARGAVAVDACAVVLSFAERWGASDDPRTSTGRVRALLPAKVDLAVGGAGAPFMPGATRFEDFATFLTWVSERKSRIPARTGRNSAT